MHIQHSNACAMRIMSTALPLLTLLLGAVGAANAADYSWQEPHAEVVGSGDLRWAPTPFVYQAGATLRYIDYQDGDDANDGLSPESPWQHHPWDDRAGDIPAAHSGPTTYVFKRGVTYRCYDLQRRGTVKPYLRADESGLPEEPIRLTSSPDWGSGEAVIAGATVIPSDWQQAGAADVPARMDPAGVWWTDTSSWFPMHPQWPSNSALIGSVVLWLVDGDGPHRLHLARDPNYQEPGANFASDYWHQWDAEADMHLVDETGALRYDENGDPVIKRRPYDDYLADQPIDWFVGGTLWSHYASFMGTPVPRRIEPGDYQPELGGLIAPHGIYDYHRKRTRYMLEDLPQLLDAPAEYYHDEATQRLFVRMPDDGDPNQAQIEMSSTFASLAVTDQSHIHVSGLTFSRNGEDGTTVSFEGNCHDVVISHCRFDHLANNAIHFECDGDDDSMDGIRVSDNDLIDIESRGIRIVGRKKSNTEKKWVPGGELQHVDVLRNRLTRIGFRHNGNQYSNVPSISVICPNTAEIAGNILWRNFGSAVVIFGGKEGNLDNAGYDVPLTRILVHHNKIEHAALGVNDYGGLALWQGGPIYSYCNISGNAVGHAPAGFLGHAATNLSYPIYLDGAFKIYNFNNIAWSRRFDPDDPYSNKGSAYFNVFGFLNQFVNNTIVGNGSGFGGTSGNRNELVGNHLVDITKKFVSSNHGGNPSLIGGGDDASSGIDGAGTLAYANNVFHGEAKAGTLVTIDRGAEKDVEADTITELAQQMQDYPIRYGQLGTAAGEELTIVKDLPRVANPDTGAADFRPAGGSPAIDGGARYFIPWSLAATVGEWHFNQDHRAPEQVLDFHFYMDRAHFHRAMYYKIPAYELRVSAATVDDYIASPSEDWAPGALRFDGSRLARVEHDRMHEDIKIDLPSWSKDLPVDPWILPEPAGGYDNKDRPIWGEGQVMTYPGALRHTLDIDQTDLLVEVQLQASAGDAGILGKFDGTSGYRLRLDGDGHAVFSVASGAEAASVRSSIALADENWHHLLAEFDRDAEMLRLSIDGALDGETSATGLAAASLANTADFLVGCAHDETMFLHGAIDFMRVCQSTLADSLTTIDELWAWQTDGPVHRDLAGNRPQGRRDVGALEAIGLLTVSELQAMIDIATGEVVLSWQDNSADEDGVLIERSTNADFSDAVLIRLAGSDRTGYRDGDTEPDTTYHYRVSPVRGDEVGPGRTVTVSWGSALPALPVEIYLMRSADLRRAFVDWQLADPSDVAATPQSWRVEWTTTPGSDYQAIDGLTESACTITGLDPTTTVHLRIVAVNQTGETATQEFSLVRYQEYFEDVAVDSLPADWTTELDRAAVTATPEYLQSPSGTPLLQLHGWTGGQTQWHGLQEAQYLQIKVVFARGDGNSSSCHLAPSLHIAEAGTVSDRLGLGDARLDAPGGRIGILADEGDADGDPQVDTGEFWTIRMMTGPSRDLDPANMNVYLQVLDETGANRLDLEDRDIDEVIGGWAVQYDVAKASADLRGIAGFSSNNTSGDGLWIDSFTVLPFRSPELSASNRSIRVDIVGGSDQHQAASAVLKPTHAADSGEAPGEHRFDLLSPLYRYSVGFLDFEPGDG